MTPRKPKNVTEIECGVDEFEVQHKKILHERKMNPGGWIMTMEDVGDPPLRLRDEGKSPDEIDDGAVTPAANPKAVSPLLPRKILEMQIPRSDSIHPTTKSLSRTLRRSPGQDSIGSTQQSLITAALRT